MLAGRSRHRRLAILVRAAPLGWRQTVARGYARTRFTRVSPRSSSRSLNPRSNVRENIARLMICVTREGEGAQTASLPACLPACLPARPPARPLLPARPLARRRRLRHGTSREETRRATAIASLGFLSPRVVRISPSRSGEPSYETIDPIPRRRARDVLPARARSRISRAALPSGFARESLLHSRTRAASGCTRDAPSARGIAFGDLTLAMPRVMIPERV